MRPVARSVPAPGSYPPDFNGLPQEQQAIVQLLHDLRVETETQDCERMAAELKEDYELRPAKRRRGESGTVPEQPRGVNWDSYADLQNEHAAAKSKFDDKDHLDPGDLNELYQTLKGIALRKETVKNDAIDKLPALYGRSRRQLIANIGQYCSYCEMPVATGLAVEHMLPKSEFPLFSLVWDNFLLACPLCNSFKNDKPDRDTGKSASPNLGARQPPVEPADPPTTQEEGWIRDGARGTYLWPSDADPYISFEQFFQYDLNKVRYDDVGRRIACETFDPGDLMRAVNSNNLKFDNDSGNTVVTSLLQKLCELDMAQSAEAWHELQGGRCNGAVFKMLCDNRLVLDPNLPAMGKTIVTAVNDTFEVTERRKYRLDLSGNPLGTIRIPLEERDADSGGNSIPLDSFDLNMREQRDFRTRLNSGVLPEQVKTLLSGDNYKVDVLKDVVEVSFKRNEADIVVAKNFLLKNDGGVLELYSVSKFQVELHLAAVNGRLSANAKRVIYDLRLNNIDMSSLGNKVTDRRMVKRTRAWFVAAESLQRLSQAVLSNNPVVPYEEMMSAIAETAKATGFWTVWWTMFCRALANAPADMRTAILHFLTDANNFPGTRSGGTSS